MYPCPTCPVTQLARLQAPAPPPPLLYLQQCVGAAQLLAQHRVHAVKVRLRELLGRGLQVKVRRQLVQDLARAGVHDVLRRLAALGRAAPALRGSICVRVSVHVGIHVHVCAWGACVCMSAC